MVTTPANLTRLSGATAWTAAPRFDDSGPPPDIYVLDDNAAAPRMLTNCQCANFAAGGGDMLAFLRYDSWPNAVASLWVSRPPFTNAAQVWAPGRELVSLSADPDNPHHMVVVAANGTDATCPQLGDVYYIDLDTIATTPPVAVTNGGVMHMFPHVRGDNVVYQEFVDPTLMCPNWGTLNNVVLTSVANGGHVVLTQSQGIAPVWLSVDRVYVYGSFGTGVVLLP